MMSPILDELAETYADKLSIAKLDIDKNSEVTAKYGVRAIPTLLLFKNGEVAGSQVGALTKSQLVAFIDSNIWQLGSKCAYLPAEEKSKDGSSHDGSV